MLVDDFTSTPLTTTQIHVLREGNGRVPKKGDYVTIHYKSRVEHQMHDFDDTWLIKKPYTFKVGERKVIDGWDIAFLSGHLREGTKADLYIPYAEAYYEKGAPPYVPAKTNLKYHIEVLQVSDHRCVIL
ncbi:hypothetical protein C9374_008375 [Naegleria lovaniensis]|uniref:peptidylprolyl isomerase n=1 Tax=Naegleria lovaniensis TaxID=51637 RepID=A0AA88GF01_NAELO|nr:uncharacterized protein C9374_008375 [Naegleria lovaniensis]KAG2378232.1 hypothetical protein C9374_008375 [Naegleria lovaniensis]